MYITSDPIGSENWIGWALEMNRDLKTFQYTDNMKGEVLFTVAAKDILEADLAINTELNIKVEKMSHIGCRVIDEVDVD